MADAVSCADAELVAAGVEFRILRDRFIKARRMSESCDHITDAMDPVFNRITALPATTLEGLAVKADLVRHYYEKGFDQSFDTSAPWDDLGTVRALVEAVWALEHRAYSARGDHRDRARTV
jgi:hypothetical protein